MRTIAALLLLAFLPNQDAWAQGSIVLYPALFVQQEESQQSQRQNDDTRTDTTTNLEIWTHLHTGIPIGNDLTIGVSLLNLSGSSETKVEFEQRNGWESENKTDMQSFGLTFGWLHGSGFSAFFSYFPRMERSFVQDQSTEMLWKNGNGYLLDLGYRFGTQGLQVGPVVTYNSAEFSELSIKSRNQAITEIKKKNRFTIALLGIGIWLEF